MRQVKKHEGEKCGDANHGLLFSFWNLYVELCVSGTNSFLMIFTYKATFLFQNAVYFTYRKPSIFLSTNRTITQLLINQLNGENVESIPTFLSLSFPHKWSYELLLRTF